MKVCTQRFKVQSGAGSVYDALTYQKEIDMTTKGDASRVVRYGLKVFKLADGRAMNCVNDTTFEIVETCERVTRI